MRSPDLDAVARTVQYTSFDIYIDGLPLRVNDSVEIQILKEYLANLAMEGVMCSRLQTPDPRIALAALGDASAVSLPVHLVRSIGVLEVFTSACRQLEQAAGPTLNGHAPTVFAASRIAQLSGNALSTVLSHGGLNILTVYDTLLEQKGRGDVKNDLPRHNEARYKMAKKEVGAAGAPKTSLREALSEAEMQIFEAELQALKEDVSHGRVPQLSYDDVMKIIAPSPR